MKEIEVKAKISNFKNIKQKLINLGCKFSEPLLQKDTIYIHKSIKYTDIKQGDSVLRIRDSNGKFIMTLKYQLETKLNNIEKEIVIDDPIQGDAILKYIDFKEVVKITKTRIKCKYNEYTICLDNIDKLGSFIEVEKITNAKEGAQVQNELFNFLKTLGVTKKQQIFKGYDTLIYEIDN